MVLAVIALAVIGYTFFLTAQVSLSVEHTGPFTAIARSFRLAGTNMKAHFGTFYIIVHLPLTLYSLSALFELLLMQAGNYLPPSVGMAVNSVLEAIAALIFMAVFSCMAALIYLDGRCRTDALDLRLLAREVGLDEEIERVVANKPASQPAAPRPTAVFNKQAPPSAAGTRVAGLTPPRHVAGFPDYSAAPPALATITPVAVAPEAASADAEQPRLTDTTTAEAMDAE